MYAILSKSGLVAAGASEIEVIRSAAERLGQPIEHVRDALEQDTMPVDRLWLIQMTHRLVGQLAQEDEAVFFLPLVRCGNRAFLCAPEEVNDLVASSPEFGYRPH